MKINKPIDIMLVEDSPEDIDLAKEALCHEKINNRLHVFMDGEGALSYLKDKKQTQSSFPDLIVLDLNLPKKNGFEVLTELHADMSFKNIPVIILTTANLTGEMIKKHKINPRLYVKKSFDFHELAQLINKLSTNGSGRDAPTQQVLTPRKSSVIASKLKRLNILLVEDNPADIDLVKEILFMKEKDEWKLQSALRLKEAIELLEREEFDLITLDLFLPDSQGIETLVQIKKHKPHIPIVVVTGLNDEDIGVAALRKGAQDYLIKGQINADLFVRTIEYAIERKRLEQFKDELLCYVNHELNNPLTVIKEGISQIHEGILGKINPKQKQYLAKSLDHINRLIRITDDLLTSAKLEFGKFELKKDTFDLVKAVRDVLFSMQCAVPKNIELKFEPSCEPLLIHADKDRLEQIVMNLVGNALKFIKNGNITVSVDEHKNSVICRVTDTGPGITKEDLGRLFDKFERSRQNNLKKVRGSGLGLYICKKLIELHDGRIWVESEIGKGTSINFAIPNKRT